MKKKLLDFQASISDVQQINPLFSTCKVRVLYTGRNRNMSSISRDAVEKALPTLKNIPIVGEFSEENKDYKGHGGKLDLDSYKFLHTTKPYGVVPESATYHWEEVKGQDGSIREYLTVDGCYLWTGRYEEAFSIVQSGKGQSMEIEVSDGRWDEELELYHIDNFTFSALCILGDDVEPAFEDASITAYSLDKDSFKSEFSTMMKELKFSLSQEKEVKTMLKELLIKYSLKVEDLTAKGIDFNEISEDELEAKIIEAFEIKAEGEGDKADDQDAKDADAENKDEAEDKGEEGSGAKEEDEKDEEDKVDFEALVADLKAELATAKSTVDQLNANVNDLTTEVEDLREFKLNVEKADHTSKVEALFANFQLTTEDVQDINIHEFKLDEIEEKCYAILGRKMAKKNFSKQSKDKEDGIRLPLGNEKQSEDTPKLYGGLLED